MMNVISYSVQCEAFSILLIADSEPRCCAEQPYGKTNYWTNMRRENLELSYSDDLDFSWTFEPWVWKDKW